MYIYCSDEMAAKGSDSSKYQSTTCSLLDLSSLAITTSVIVPTPYNIHLEHASLSPLTMLLITDSSTRLDCANRYSCPDLKNLQRKAIKTKTPSRAWARFCRKDR
jgi:hypothetical protein